MTEDVVTRVALPVYVHLLMKTSTLPLTTTVCHECLLKRVIGILIFLSGRTFLLDSSK